MPYITARAIRHVTHIGHLDSDREGGNATLNGPGIAVSTDAETWRSIAGLNGPEWELSCPTAQWVDAMAFSLDDIEDLKAWMLMKRYMKPVTAWAVSWEDEVTGIWRDEVFRTREEACRAVGRSMEDEIKLSGSLEGATSEIDTFILEKRAMKRLGGWPDALRWHDAAMLLYTREVIMEKRPHVVGVWWDEPVSREYKTAPYGVLFPERLDQFNFENEEGDIMSFREAFPEFKVPEVPDGDENALARLIKTMKAEEQVLIDGGMDPKLAAAQVARRYVDR